MTAEAQSTPSSRRAVLAAALGGLAALVAQALGRPAPTRAGTDGDVALNEVRGVTSETGVTMYVGLTPALVGKITGPYGGTAVSGDGGSYGVGVAGTGLYGVIGTGKGFAGIRGTADVGTGAYGYSGPLADAPPDPINTGAYGYAAQDSTARGVAGQTTAGRGVEGKATTGIGVYGSSNTNFAVQGRTTGGGIGVIGESSTATAGVVGKSNGSTGVYGYSTGESGLADIPAKTGVLGRASQDASARGVWGQSNAGIGVQGDASTGHGVYGQATTGKAVRGAATAAGGVGVRAEAPLTGTALQVSGKAIFSRSGKVAIAAGRSYVTKTAIPLSSSSLVLAVLQTNRSGIYVRAAVVNPATSSFTIYLNTAVRATTYVAWFVLG
jgi:hypothetical protein